MKKDSSFKPVDSKVNFPKLEESILQYWDKEKIFDKTISEREGAKDYVTFDGPPGTNGKPHVGHMMQSALKDLWPRFKTMQGYRVLRKAGWDTHGLPVEIQAEKELGLHEKEEIESYGVDKFVEYCRSIVFSYKDEWIRAIKRIGRFLDTDNDYATLTNDFIQTDWWGIKQAHKKNLLYKDFKILPYCSRCGTSLSSHEVAQGYEDITDTSAFVRFKVEGENDTYFLAWTTTPWTLIGNVALAVGPKVDYVLAETEEWGKLYLAKEKLALLDEREISYKIIKELKGADLVEKTYEPLWNFFKPEKDQKAFIVVGEDFVTTEDGSGIVHMALYGEDDWQVIKKYDLPRIQHVGLDGKLTSEVGNDWAGLGFKEVDPKVIADLDKRKLLFAKENYTHSYPFCWRCKTPLIYYAKSSWFIKSTALREKMLTENKKINWQPPSAQEGRFGKWLEGNVDWAISRERFWGSPLPIWHCTDCDEMVVVGSIAELRELANEDLPADDKIDLHKPFIDTITINCPKCSAKLTREPETLDSWYNAGMMPWGQWGYPAVEGSEKTFKSQFPADFIAEGQDQTRGWFYTLLVCATMLEEQASFKNVIMTSLILDDKGQKMSKSKGNVTDPLDMFDKYGAEAVRWNFYRNNPWNPMRFGPAVLEETLRDVLIPLWNVYSFFVTYANIDDWKPAKKKVKLTNDLDRWIISAKEELIGEVTNHLENYDVAKAAASFEKFLDGLTNWYVRRSRRRFWKSEDDADKKAAYQTLYEVLVDVTHALAPFLPFITEEMYQNLVVPFDKKAAQSVHLAKYPKVNKKALNENLNKQIEKVLVIARLARAARSKASLKVRQPLAKLTVAGMTDKDMKKELQEALLEEVNIKSLEFIADVAELSKREIKLNFKVAGKKFGADVKDIQKMIASGEFTEESDGTLTVGEHKLDQEDYLEQYSSEEGQDVLVEGDLAIVLDTALTEKLKQEGIVRDIVRAVQDLRKEAGYELTDRIKVSFETSDESVKTALENFADYLKSETLAESISLEKSVADAETDLDLDGQKIWLGVKK
ncbi:isoleucine--tRNA ligase [Patescibacteria group bacterium]